MPEISDSEYRTFLRYQDLGTLEEIRKKISDLQKDNKKERDKNREMQSKLPKENEVVVPKEEAELLLKYKELGKPDEIKGKISKGDEAAARLAILDREKTASNFAQAVKLAPEAVATLIAIPDLKDAQFVVENNVGHIQLGNEKLTFEQAQAKIPALKGLRTAGGVQFVKQSGENNGGQPGTVYDRIRDSRKPGANNDGVPPVNQLSQRLGMS